MLRLHARQFLGQAAARQIVVHHLADFTDHLAEAVVAHHLRVERQHDQRQRAVIRQQLAANDLVGLHRLDELVVVRALRQIVREQRRRQLAGFGRLPR